MKVLKSILALLVIGGSLNAQNPVTNGINFHLDPSTGFTANTWPAKSTWNDPTSGITVTTTNFSTANPTVTNVGTYNGYTAVSFSGTSMMESALLPALNNTSATIFVVTSTGATNCPTSYGNGTDGSVDNEFVVQNFEAYHHQQPSVWIGQPHECSGNLPAGSAVVVTGSFGQGHTDLNDIACYINGARSNSLLDHLGTTTTDYTASSRNLCIGGRDQISGSHFNLSPFNGFIYEVIGYSRRLSDAEVELVSHWLQCKYSINYQTCSCNAIGNVQQFGGAENGCSVNSTDHNVVLGQDVGAGGNPARLLSNREIPFNSFNVSFTGTGNVGIGVSSPTQQLHTTGGVRFAGLTTGAATRTIVSDGNGVLYYQTGTPMTSSCSTSGYVPKSTGANTESCSLIYDNGTSVGISTTGSFAYSTNPQLQGTTAAPSSGTVKLDVNGVTRSLAFLATSDARSKTNIKPIEDALTKVLALDGKTYYWDAKTIKENNADNSRQLGFIAQEVQKILPEAVVQDADGKYAMNYNMVIPVLAEAIKELHGKMQKTEQENADLKQQINDICSYGCAGLRGTGSNEATTPGNQLLQNVPNPYSAETTIGYVINTGSTSYINVNAIDGKIIKHVEINTKGAGSITMSGSEFSAGTYTYSLYVDGKVIDTKIMVISATK